MTTGPAPTGSNPGQRRAHEEIAAAQQRLAQRFKAWRESAGLSHEELGLRTGYSRTGIRNAERCTSRARELFEAADTATGAGGALLAERDQTVAAISAIRKEAARRARSALAQQAGSPLRLSTAEPGAVAVLDLHCPGCDTHWAATLGIHVALTTPLTDARSEPE
ncbi:MAG: helix-turn-helix domain-containing protein [Streptosporangiaceae bacterium]